MNGPWAIAWARRLFPVDPRRLEAAGRRNWATPTTLQAHFRQYLFIVIHGGHALFRHVRPPPDTPGWFAAAVTHKPDLATVEVDGCRIHVRAWGETTKPPLVLVHGGGAHSGWWDHIAPFFAKTHRVVALDLSGHGDSDTRSIYQWDTWAREVLAAAEVSGASGLPIVVGHSMGGWVTATAAFHYGKQIDGIVVIDSPLRGRAPEESRLSNRQPRATGYRAKQEILARFTPVPKQELVLPYISAHIAAQSVRKTARGWDWKFDPAIFSGSLIEEASAEQEVMEQMLAEMPCRVAYLHCEAGLVPPAMAEHT